MGVRPAPTACIGCGKVCPGVYACVSPPELKVQVSLSSSICSKSLAVAIPSWNPATEYSIAEKETSIVAISNHSSNNLFCFGVNVSLNCLSLFIYSWRMASSVIQFTPLEQALSYIRVESHSPTPTKMGELLVLAKCRSIIFLVKLS